MAIKLPYGAEGILNLRKHGKRPADMLLVSLIGPLPDENNPVVVAQLGCQYDWRFLTELECLVVAKSDQPAVAIRKIMDHLKALPTRYLGLWFADRQEGINFVVDGVTARPRGLLRYTSTEDRRNFSGIGQRKEHLQCA